MWVVPQHYMRYPITTLLYITTQKTTTWIWYIHPWSCHCNHNGRGLSGKSSNLLIPVDKVFNSWSTDYNKLKFLHW